MLPSGSMINPPTNMICTLGKVTRVAGFSIGIGQQFLAEGVVGIAVLDIGIFVDNQTDAAEAVVEIKVFIGGVIAGVLSNDLIVGVDIGFDDLAGVGVDLG